MEERRWIFLGWRVELLRHRFRAASRELRPPRANVSAGVETPAIRQLRARQWPLPTPKSVGPRRFLPFCLLLPPLLAVPTAARSERVPWSRKCFSSLLDRA